MDKAKKRKHDASMQDSNAKSSKEGAIKNSLVCDLCQIAVPNKSSMIQHILGKEHKKCDSAEEERKRVEQKCGLFIRGYPSHLTPDVILDYFLNYGKIVWVHFGHAFVLLDYSEPLAVQNVMNKRHFLGGRRVMIHYRKLKKEVCIEKPVNVVEETSNYIQKVKDVPKFDDQLEVLIQQLQPHIQEQFPKYRKICCDLHRILSYSFPRCEIFPFGSTVTGLHFKNSDVDVYVSGIREGDNDKPFLYRIKSLLLSSQRFANIIVIARAKIPILKCIHIETGISCDINLRNNLGVCNSRLINYYLNVDSKIKKLMILLKYWAKVHKMTGQSYLFSNYSLCLMFIFFLQQEPYNFPSVWSLQQNPQTFHIHDDWNGGFQQIDIDASCLSNMSLLNLLENFFAFYADFDYGTNVICPFLGRSIRKDQFDNPGSLPDSYSSYNRYLQVGKPLKSASPICIQDPFEHYRNTTTMVAPDTLGTFISFCLFNKTLCHGEESTLLHNLLTMTPPKHTPKRIVNTEFCQFSIPMKSHLKFAEENIDNTLNRHEAIRNAWFKSVVDFTMVVLKDFLKFDVTELNETTSKVKNNKVEGQSDVYDSKNIPVSYQCLGNINLWTSRKVTSKINKSEVDEEKPSIIKKEIAITNYLCDLYKDITPAPIINFEITLENHSMPPQAEVNVKKISAYKNTFKSFAVFLSANLCNWFEIYQKETNS